MTTVQHGAVTANTYRSYRVRFWQSNEQGCWRASAQCVQTGETVRFGDVESLLLFSTPSSTKKEVKAQPRS